MTWLGKIMTFLVLIGALVWAWFTASVYATRTSWQKQAQVYKAALDEARAAREAEHKSYAAALDAANREVASLKEKSQGLSEQIAAMQGSNKAVVAASTLLDQTIKESDVKAATLAANYQGALDELNRTRARSNALEDLVKDLTLARTASDRDRQAAENLARQAQAEALLAQQKAERLQAELQEVRSWGTGIAAAPGSARPAAPVPEGLRGTVEAVSDDYVVVSVGLDAGVTVGAVLDVYRAEGGKGQYLGTVTISRVEPKQALGVFKPADPKRTIKQLRPEELPKKGDVVGRVPTSASFNR